MPRPVNERLLAAPLALRVFKPAGVPARELEEVLLGFDEAEALRLADLEGLYQEAAARSMGVSRQTFGRIVEIARRKVADAILNGKVLRMEGGPAAVKDGEGKIMKIAVPSRDGRIDEHFGHCKEFLIFRAEGSSSADSTLIEEGSLPSPESCGCKSGIASLLARMGVTHLVAGNMGEGAVRVLGAQGIKVVRGASGDPKAAALAFLTGRIEDSGAGCAGHAGHGADHECSH
ncbi:MAG: DUF134 domain-containing protein [Spirochaetota bacterium]